MSLGKCKLEQQWDTTTHLLEQPNSGTQTAPNAGEDMEQQKPSFIAGGNEKGCRHFEGKFGGYLQNKTCSYYRIQQSSRVVENLCKHT